MKGETDKKQADERVCMCVSNLWVDHNTPQREAGHLARTLFYTSIRTYMTFYLPLKGEIVLFCSHRNTKSSVLVP
jgi:hypothetical protein